MTERRVWNLPKSVMLVEPGEPCPCGCGIRTQVGDRGSYGPTGARVAWKADAVPCSIPGCGRRAYRIDGDHEEQPICKPHG